MAFRRAAFGLLTTLLLVSLTPLTDAYPSGAPTSACTSMVPGHVGVSRQTSAVPFNITVSQSTYAAGDVITVQIIATGSTPLAGFLVEARRADSSLDTTTPLGTFSALPANTQALQCSAAGDAVTHTSATTVTFNNLTLTWTAPSPTPAGHIVFKGTLATAKTMFWVGAESPMVTDPTAAAIVTTPATVQATTTDNTAIDVTGCGNSKGCLRIPSGCVGSACTNILTWTPGSTTIDFELSRSGQGWAGVGFSKDTTMGDDSVLECLRDSSGAMMVGQSYNTPNVKENVDIPNPTEGITNVKVGYINGVQVCRFTRQKLVTGRTDKIFDLNKPYYLLIADGATFGSIGDSTIGIAKHTKAPSVSGEMVDVDELSNVSGGQSINIRIKAHGALMIVAWVITAAFGIVMARHYKKQWPGEKLFGKDVWYPLHAMAMITTSVLTIIAFILIFIHVGGYSDLSSASVAVLKAHPVLGIIVTGLAVINPIMAMCRPHPEAPTRYIFNWAHWGVGVTARVLAVITIFLGLNLDSVKIGNVGNLTYVMIGYVCFYVLIEVILELHKCFTSSAKTGSSMELKSPGEYGDGGYAQSSNGPTEGISGVSVGYVDGVQVCRFTRQKAVSGRTTQIFDLGSLSYYLIMAQGSTFGTVSAGSSGVSKHTTKPSVTSAVVSMTTISDVSASATIHPMVKAHGSMMILAWVLCSTFGILFARHYKQQWKSSKACGKDVWFVVHISFMLTCVALTISAFIVIFVHVGGYSHMPNATTASQLAHPVLGIMVTMLAVLNPIMAAFRPAPDAKNRWIFKWAHWGVGTSARIFSVVTIFLGLNLDSVKVGNVWTLTWVYLAFVLWIFIGEVIFEVYNYMHRNRNPDQDGCGAVEDGSSFCFRSVMLHLFLIQPPLGFAIGMICNICIN